MYGIARPDLDRLLYLTNNPVHNPPVNFNLSGLDSNGDATVDFWPIPNSTDSIRFSLIVPESDFSADTDTTKMPKEPIVLGAYARALVERGEDQGLTSSEAQAIYKQSLADFIANEGARSPETDSWGLV